MGTEVEENPMKRLHRFANVSVAVAVVCSVLVATGIRANAAPARGTVTVSLAGWSVAGGSEQVALSKLIKTFEAKYKNIKVNYQVINGDYATVMKARITAGSAPDVFYMNSDVAQSFIQTGQLMNLDVLGKDKSYGLSKIYKSLIQGYEWKGHIYGIPKDYSTLAMWYNKDLFQAAGISGPPSTWAQFTTDACKLTDKSKKQYGAILSTTPDRWLAFVYAAGGQLFNKNQTKVTIDSAASKAAVDFYAGLVQKGCAAIPSTVGAGWNGQAFGQVNAAMVFEGNWLTNTMQTQYPGVHWGTAALPKGPKGSGNLSFTAAYVIYKNSHHPTEALTLLKYLTSKGGETTWAKLNSYIPSRSDAKPVNGTQVFIKAVKYSRDWFFPPHFSTAITVMGNDMQKVMEGSMSSSDALKDMQTQGNNALNAP
jgi:multiple sugar transport system substrate-binding protein